MNSKDYRKDGIKMRSSGYKRFLFNGLLITATSLVLKFTGVSFNSYLSKKLGTDGMGLYTLITSVYTFAVVFASSGISLGTTRLVSEARARNDGSEVKKSVKTAAFYCLMFSLFACAALYLLSEPIGAKLLCDERTVKPLKILAFSLPFVSLSSVFSGFFTAVREAYKGAASVFFENFINIYITVRLITALNANDLGSACVSVAAGTVVSEFLALVFSLVMYLFESKKIKGGKREKTGLMKKLASISLPLSLSAYARQGLVTVEHLLIPFGLKKHGMTQGEAMSAYGVVHGMAFPVVMFPSCLVYSFASLIVPEFAEYREKREINRIGALATKGLRYAVLFAVGTAGIMHCFSYEICLAFYSSPEPYKYISLFSPLICVMYLDAMTDGMLKGLNEQLYSMKINILDALLSVAAVWLLVPRFGINGYVFSVFFCEIFNFTTSFIRLVSICEIRIDLIKDILLPVFSVILATNTVSYVCSFVKPFSTEGAAYLLIRVVVSAVLYCIPLKIFEKKRKPCLS